MKKFLLACFVMAFLAVFPGCATSSGPNPALDHGPMGPGALPDAPNF